MRPFVVVVIFAAALLGAALPRAVPAAETCPLIESVSVGYQGVYKVGHWTPVRVAVKGGSTSQAIELEIVAPDTDGVPVQFLEADSEIRVGAGATTTVLRYFKPGRTTGELVVRLRQGRGVVAERRAVAGPFGRPLPADYPLVVTCGEVPLAHALPQARRLSGSAEGAPRVERAEELPDDWLGYEGVNVLVLPTSRAEFIEALSARQIAAIQQWVRMGGRLVFSVGVRGEEVLADGSPWVELAPGRFSGVVPVRSTSALENYSGSAEPLTVRAFGPAALRMTRLHDVRGKVELSDTATDGLRPIIVRHAYGLGIVTFIAYDLDAPPLAGWEGTPRLMAKVLDRLWKVSERGAGEPRMGRIVHEGYRDLVGQLRAALDDFPGVTLVAFSWIAGLALLYIVLIGPADYFFLGRLIGQMQWTWLTFPALVLGFGGLAVVLNITLKDDRIHVNQAEIVDIDVQSGTVRGTAWFHAYSPDTRAYDFATAVHAAPLPVRKAGEALSWQGLPGAGLGGMSSDALSASFPNPYAIIRQPEQGMRITGLPIAVGSTKSLLGRWWGSIELDAAADLDVRGDGLLRGTISNPLPVELTDCTVLFENWAYRLDSTHGNLRPGESVQIEREHPFNLEWRLMRRRVKDTDQVITPWDAGSKDIPRILEIMMFHRAAGATGYTQLTHQYQNFVDLSDHLTAGCAVLVGRIASPAARLKMAGVEQADRIDEAWTFVRMVWPVRPRSAPPPESDAL